MVINKNSTLPEMAEERLDTPYGNITIWATQHGLVNIDWTHLRAGKSLPRAVKGLVLSPVSEAHPARLLACQAAEQLREYFAGRRTQFDLPLVWEGTPFQMAVWNALTSIPYGETRSYADVARLIENPSAVRAVGQANRKNPFIIVVPCHRVIGANGDLVGYAGTQTELKSGLLELESVAFRTTV